MPRQPPSPNTARASPNDNLKATATPPAVVARHPDALKTLLYGIVLIYATLETLLTDLLSRYHLPRLKPNRTASLGICSCINHGHTSTLSDDCISSGQHFLSAAWLPHPQTSWASTTAWEKRLERAPLVSFSRAPIS
jgi:hypothetical protein